MCHMCPFVDPMTFTQSNLKKSYLMGYHYACVKRYAGKRDAVVR
jgi:hypothetical protein